MEGLFNTEETQREREKTTTYGIVVEKVVHIELEPNQVNLLSSRKKNTKHKTQSSL